MIMIRVGVIQQNVKSFKCLRSLKNPFSSLESLITKCVMEKAKYVFLPEASDYINESESESESAIQSHDQQDIEHGQSYQTFHENFRSFLGKMAKLNNVWIFAGLHEPCEDFLQSKKCYNSYIAFRPSDGEACKTYRKIHLFDIYHKRESLKESSHTRAGDSLVVLEDDSFIFGFQICYDMRFPELSLALSNEKGANVLLFPSAFSRVTGPAHWEILLRARAIENQAFVIASAQVGNHNATRNSWGNSMVINPWGKVLCQMDGETEGYCIADLDLSEIQQDQNIDKILSSISKTLKFMIAFEIDFILNFN